MRLSKPVFALICVLISALMLRAAISATMPIKMMGKTATAVVSMEHMSAAAEAMDSVDVDCPGHRAMQSAQSQSSSGEMSCAWCGECCVSAPVFAFNPDQNIVKTAPQVVFARIAVPRLAYLTPGLYRPPAA
jgi:succinate dehydrogenase/fumarate reductase-like Fe-S protein